jgi:hypothetical protein
MKKFSISIFISIFLLFNIFIDIPAFAINVFTEGIYKTTDFNFSPLNLYNVQNISSTDSVYVFILDENQLQMQSIRLIPKSATYNLVPLRPGYRVVVVGKGQVYIDKTNVKNF